MHNTKISSGFWLAVVLAYGLKSPLQTEWVELLILLAAWVGVPSGLGATLRRPASHWIWWTSAAMLSISFWRPSGYASGVLALPWLGISLWALYGQRRERGTEGILVRWALLFWAIASSWSVLHALGWQPLDFSPVIVLLTAAHFHYAGFLLLLLLALAYRQRPERRLRMLAYGTIGSTALVAISITITRLGGPFAFEAISGILMAVAGALVATHYISLATHRSGVVKVLWYCGGILLLAGMVLALSYALRTLYPTQALGIPQMYAWHGTANAVALFLLLFGWLLSPYSSYPPLTPYPPRPAQG